MPRACPVPNVVEPSDHSARLTVRSSVGGSVEYDAYDVFLSFCIKRRGSTKSLFPCNADGVCPMPHSKFTVDA